MESPQQVVGEEGAIIFNLEEVGPISLADGIAKQTTTSSGLLTILIFTLKFLPTSTIEPTPTFPIESIPLLLIKPMPFL